MTLDVLMIGAGGIAGRHATMLARTEGVRLAAVVDPVRERAEALAGKHAARPFTDLEAALDAARYDYALLLTTRQVRAEPIARCIAAGLPLMIEKPPCASLEEGERIAGQLAASGLVHGVGFMHRYSEALDAALRALDGRRILALHTTIVTPLAAMARDPATRDYPFSVAASGGIVGEVAIHYLDLLRWVCGGEVAAVQAFGSNLGFEPTPARDTRDTVATALALGDGTQATMLHTWAGTEWHAELEIVAAGARIRVGLMPTGDHQRAHGQVDGATFVHESTADDNLHHHRAFRDAVRTGSMAPIRSSYADAVQTVALTERVQAALRDRP